MGQEAREKKEQEYITQLKKNMNPDDLEGLYYLYLKLTQKPYFKTATGKQFLRELQEYLTKNGYNLPQQPEEKREKETELARLYRKNEALQEQLAEKKSELERLEVVKIRLTIAVAALAVLVIGMIFILITNDNIGYFNAEQKIQDKYAYWEEQLDEREQELLEWEKELSEQENHISDVKTQK